MPTSSRDPGVPYRTATLVPPPVPRMGFALRGDPRDPSVTARDVAWFALAAMLFPAVFGASWFVREGLSRDVLACLALEAVLTALWARLFVRRVPLG